MLADVVEALHSVGTTGFFVWAINESDLSRFAEIAVHKGSDEHRDEPAFRV